MEFVQPLPLSVFMKFLLYPQEPVVLRSSLTPRGGTGLYLTAANPYSQICHEGVLSVPGSMGCLDSISVVLEACIAIGAGT